MHFPPLSGGQMLHTHTHMCTHPVTHVPHVRAQTHLRSTHWSFPGVFHFLICWDWIRRCSLVLLGVICSVLSSMQPHLQNLLLPCENASSHPTQGIFRVLLPPSLPQQKKKNCLHSCTRNIFPIKEASIIKMQNGKEEGASGNFQSRKNQKCL